MSRIAITCPHCGRQYIIAAGKGRAVKIRCERCFNLIVVMPEDRTGEK